MNIVLNAPIMAWYYQVVLNKSYAFFQLPRFSRIWRCSPESVLLILFLMVMIPLAYRMHLVYDAGDQLHLKKRQAILLGVLFLLCRRLCGGIFCLRLQQQRPGVLVEHRGEGGGQHRPSQRTPGPRASLKATKSLS